MNRVAAALIRPLTRTPTRAAFPAASSSITPSILSSSSFNAVDATLPNNNRTPTSSRSVSSSSKVLQKNVTPAAADRRIAGRRRFYQRVGVAPTSPPTRPDKQTAKNKSNDNDNDNNAVESPISAGVDGTQSATGVTTTISDSDRWSSLLNSHHNNDVTTTTQQQPQEWHTVTLDGRNLRTPLGLPLTLPSLSLALAIASEWDAQLMYLQPAQMPLMTLACTAIDQVASDPTAHRADVMRYLGNDTSCYWSDPSEDRALHRRQSKAWGNLHSSLSSNLLGLPGDLGPAQAVGGGEALLMSRKSKGNPNIGLPHPPLLVEKAKRWVESLDAWRLTALYSACAESKSFFIGAALIHEAIEGVAASGAESKNNKNVRDGKWAAEASRVEEEFNIECWGLVEGGHDYDRLNCSIQMHAASFLAQTTGSVRQ